ncbi:uncharacterized protein VTP21DRAFT_7266 [Calcarisporiella thermophila]|uniref:uncharacterized protein n=1 Tax=Calcarisporiella thermophila TaxID=911321 RepID=UPI0037446FF4
MQPISAQHLGRGLGENFRVCGLWSLTIALKRVPPFVSSSPSSSSCFLFFLLNFASAGISFLFSSLLFQPIHSFIFFFV